MKLKKLEVEAMAVIEPAANTHCESLKASPVKVPGVPAKSFMFSPLPTTVQHHHRTQYSSNLLMGYFQYPSSQITNKVQKLRKAETFQLQRPNFTDQNYGEKAKKKR